MATFIKDAEGHYVINTPAREHLPAKYREGWMYDTDKMEITPKQERVIGELIAAIRISDGNGKDHCHKWEFTSIEITQSTTTSKLVFLNTAMNLKGGGNYYTEHRRNISIGPRGGLYLINPLVNGKSFRRGFYAVVNRPAE